MVYSNLGRSGLKIGKISLGTMNFGQKLNRAESFEILDQAIDKGINLIDTADIYGGSGNIGLSEKIIGEYFSKNKANREKVIIGTKVYGKTGAGANDARLSAYHIIKGCEESLKRLGTDRIDLYQMHHIDRETPWDEIWQAFDKLIHDGKVLYVGSSNFPAWQLAKARGEAIKRNILGIISEQSIYNLCERTVELEVLPACQNLGIGFLCWSPLEGGMLANKAVFKEDWSTSKKKRWEKYQSRLTEWSEFCSNSGKSSELLAISWLLHNPLVNSVIIGPSQPSHLDNSLKALEVRLRSDELDEINRIWAGPGGPAPEAYAW